MYSKKVKIKSSFLEGFTYGPEKPTLKMSQLQSNFRSPGHISSINLKWYLYISSHIYPFQVFPTTKQEEWGHFFPYLKATAQCQKINWRWRWRWLRSRRYGGRFGFLQTHRSLGSKSLCAGFTRTNRDEPRAWGLHGKSGSWRGPIKGSQR